MRGGIIIKDNRVNEEIQGNEFRVIDEDGSMLGIMTRDKALDIARERKLDLVEVSPNANPAVCKILDYGKFRYAQQKKEKQAKKNQKVMQLKEIRLSAFIGDHDLEVKANNARGFLKSGDKVKVSLRFRGREMGHKDLGREVMDKFAELCSEEGIVDKKPNMEGRSMVMFMIPKNDKK